MIFVSQVKFYSFLYPLSIKTKKGRKCGFFLRFYMLEGEMHAFVRGSCVSSCYGECLPPYCLGTSFNFLYTSLVTMFTYIMLIFDIYIWWCMSSSPTSTCIISFLSLYTCFLLYAIFYFCFTLRCLDEFCLKFFRKTSCQNLSCYELSSCKVFQEFVLWLDFNVLNKWLWV